MNNLVIQGTKSTPEVDFNRETGVLSLTGAAYPENSFAFFKPVLEWTKEFAGSTDQPIELRIDLKYLNTSSTKCLMSLIRFLDGIPDADRLVKVTWLYDPGNDTILEVAEEFMVGLQFEFTLKQKQA